MKSLCTTCKNKVACDAHRRCYGYPNYRVTECIGYEPKDESQTMYYPQVDGITPSVIVKDESRTERSEK